MFHTEASLRSQLCFATKDGPPKKKASELRGDAVPRLDDTLKRELRYFRRRASRPMAPSPSIAKLAGSGTAAISKLTLTTSLA